MHNIIIEDDRGQDLNDYVYDLMGHPMQPQHRHERLAQFIECYQTFVTPMCMMIFRRMSPRNGGHGMANKSAASFHVTSHK
jgi:hypothetical protein